jgi:hypothetical protein
VNRTLSTHIDFHLRFGLGQRKLFNVLRAFSISDEKVGYCQGMSTVCAILLLYYDEETTFIMMRYIFQYYQLDQLFQPGFPALLEAIQVQRKLLLLKSPKLVEYMDQIGLIPEMYAIRWYCTLFSDGILSHDIVLRIWDIFMLRGFDTLICVSVALLLYFQGK